MNEARTAESGTGLSMTPEQWLGALADAWDLGHRSLCRRHGVAPFAACRNPYRVTHDPESGPPEPGQLCTRHWSWLCQAGQGECQKRTPPIEHSHPTGGAWNVTRWAVPGCPACDR